MKAANIVRPLFPGVSPNFRVITLKEPPKTEMVAYLAKRLQRTTPARTARVQVVVPGVDTADALHELIVDLDKDTILDKRNLKGKHSYIDASYMKEVERACLADERIQTEIRKLNLPSGSTPCVEPWAYATDGINDMSSRVTMVCTHINPNISTFV